MRWHFDKVMPGVLECATHQTLIYVTIAHDVVRRSILHSQRSDDDTWRSTVYNTSFDRQSWWSQDFPQLEEENDFEKPGPSVRLYLTPMGKEQSLSTMVVISRL